MKAMQAIVGFAFLVLFAAFLYNLRAIVKPWWFSLDTEGPFPFECLECEEIRFYTRPGELSAALAAHWETDCTAVRENQ